MISKINMEKQRYWGIRQKGEISWHFKQKTVLLPHKSVS